MVLLESALLGIVSAFIGSVIGLAVVWFHTVKGFDISPFAGKNMLVGSFNMDVLIYPEFKLIPFIKAIGYTLTVVSLAALYPAIRAARLDPINAIRGV
jgi:ABC-type lipoprotein release transport system permease subunit